MASPAAAATAIAPGVVVPCPPTASTSFACGSPPPPLMSALRYQDARCQNSFALASASCCVAASRPRSACHGASSLSVSPGTFTSAATEPRSKDSVEGQIALPPKPSAWRWYEDMRVRSPCPEKTLMMITFCPSSRRCAISPPHESAASSGCGEMKMWLMGSGQRNMPRAVTALRAWRDARRLGRARCRGRGEHLWERVQEAVAAKQERVGDHGGDGGRADQHEGSGSTVSGHAGDSSGVSAGRRIR